MVKPNEIESKAQRFAEQNLKFRAFLKNRAGNVELDAQFLALHEELFEDFDCCKCANCCKAYRVCLDSNDIKRVSEHLEITESDFIAKYLVESNEEKPYIIKETPCPFLCDDGRCQIQSSKPEDCVGFPFTDKPNRLSSMYSVIENTQVCPVVFEIIERLKAIYGFRNKW